jgi:hypothetical protein
MIRLLRKTLRLGLLGGLGYGLYKSLRGRRAADTWSESWVSTGRPGATVPAAAPMPPPPAPIETASVPAASPAPPAPTPAPGSVTAAPVHPATTEPPGQSNGEATPTPAVSDEPADSNGQVKGEGDGESVAASRPVASRAPKSSKTRPARRTPTGKAEEPPGERFWVAANDGVCPPTHPVKAKLSSKIFHAPGSRNYGRTHADRCYPDEQSAQADGLRPAQR